MQLASNFKAINNEANFGSPITDEVVGGAHITFEFITRKRNVYFMTRWPNGLPRHEDPTNCLRFPHGLLQFGETVDQCAKRIVSAQLGFSVKNAKVVAIDSYLDEMGHWHIEPCCIVEVAGRFQVPYQASEIVSFTVDKLPHMTFWKRKQFLDFISQYG